MKPVQYFSKAYIQEAKNWSPDQIAQYLEDFRQMSTRREPSKLISLRMPQSLLEAFKRRAQELGEPYQTRIKHLIENDLSSGGKS